MNGRLRVHCFALSLDGYGAGPAQSLEHPLGVGGDALHRWSFATRSFRRKVLGDSGDIGDSGEGGSTGIDDGFIARGFDGIGASIIGRNMFGPVRGPWPDDSWRGWWGDEPPYHGPVFVLTQHARAPLVMAGGTTFHFVTDGIEAALRRARDAAGAEDVRLGGGVATLRQYLRAGLVDDLHLAITPALLGRGEALFAGLDLNAIGYRCAQSVAGEMASHMLLTRAAT